jgi:1-pyrroline-5-carboxylate dehydrogenase
MEVGMKLLRENGARAIPRPVIIEMGGKNPAIITGKADLEKASDGVYRSAFGAQGQKCSACSRIYVSKEVRDRFVQQLVEKTRKIKIGNPLERDVWMGPVVNEGASSLAAIASWMNRSTTGISSSPRSSTGCRKTMRFSRKNCSCRSRS